MSLLPQEVIRAKRLGCELAAADIADFVRGMADDTIGDAQLGAFAMAVCLRGMSPGETVALTLAMRDSGSQLDWHHLPGPVVDKHSTGGVGDKVSLILAPILAACGCFVPMVSGRGLGHTGGTLDKLESLPGYDVTPAPERLRQVVADAGCAIVGATSRLAPADARLYAVRDVTATVESVPLITASILAKKLAAGARTLVMDVKVGSGAFLPEPDVARELARSIVTVAQGAGLHCSALLTDMNGCLGQTAGNALEVAEAMAMLRGDVVDPMLREVTLALAGEALALCGLCTTPTEGVAMAALALASGAAAERFSRMVTGLGGPSDAIEQGAAKLPRAPLECPFIALRAGWVAAIDARLLGLAVVELGGGRRRTAAAIDHAVGLSEVVGRGTWVERGATLARIHARDEAGIASAEQRLAGSFILTDTVSEQGPAVLGQIR